MLRDVVHSVVCRQYRFGRYKNLVSSARRCKSFVVLRKYIEKWCEVVATPTVPVPHPMALDLSFYQP
jgi:hypothetical protein